MPVGFLPASYIVLIFKFLCFLACILILYTYNHLDILTSV